MIQGVIYKIVGRQLPGEFCRASAPGQRVAEMSAVQAEWSNRNGLSVDVRPEEQVLGDVLLMPIGACLIDNLIGACIQSTHTFNPHFFAHFLSAKLGKLLFLLNKCGVGFFSLHPLQKY